MGWLLCSVFGIHKWQYGIDYVRDEDGVTVFILRRCERCGHLEDVPHIKTVKGGFIR